MVAIIELLDNKVLSVRTREKRDDAAEAAWLVARENGAKGTKRQVREGIYEKGFWEDGSGYRVEIITVCA